MQRWWSAIQAVWIPGAGFILLLAFFMTLRDVLMSISSLDAFEKSGIGILVALVLLLAQPVVCRFVATRIQLSKSATRVALIGGVVSSLALLLPAAVLFME